jgi:pseudaminic acid synthase
MSGADVKSLLAAPRPTLIAEIHPQHQGRLDLLREMMLQAREAGVDLCKIQVYDSVRTLKSDKWQYLEYQDKDLEDLFSFAAALGMSLFASVFSTEDFERMLPYRMPVYKIASRTVQDEALCRRMLATGAPVICSLGSWKQPGLPFARESHPNLFYLSCVSEYPTPLAKTAYAFGNFSTSGIDGVSDHSVGPAVAIAAIAHGARIVERHMSMTKYRYVETEKGHLCSSDPEEFRLLRHLGDRIALARTLNGVSSRN